MKLVPAIYYICIGKIITNFNIRFKEHIAPFRLNKPQRKQLKHILDNNHTCTIDKLKILHIQPKYFKLNTLEALELKKKTIINKLPLMKEQLDQNNSPLLKILNNAALLYFVFV